MPVPNTPRTPTRWAGSAPPTRRSDPADAGAFAFPVFLEVRGRVVFVAGGGRQAAAKARSLAELGALVRVWAPEHRVTAALAERASVELVGGAYSPALLADALLTVVATGDRALDRRIATDARARRVLVNAVDGVPFCDWSAPAILRRGGLTVAIGTGGVAPALGVRLRDRLAHEFGPELGQLLELFAELRPTITGSGRPFAERRALWYALVDGPALDFLRAGDLEAARSALRHAVEVWLGRGEIDVSGIVYLVGAGPGDPGLITVRGARLLSSAEAVVHDRLVARELLDLAPVDALRYDVGKEGYRSSVVQSSTSELLVRLARGGLRVVRLKGGDPFVFGRGAEEAMALADAGIRFEVVPGVTAGVAGPAYAGIPLTHRGLSRSAAFVTAVTATGEFPDWGSLAAVDTLVVFMAGRAARGIAEGLLAGGRPLSTPVALIRSATLPDEELRLTDLGTLAAAGVGPPDGRPTLLVVGAVAALGHALAWRPPSERSSEARLDDRPTRTAVEAESAARSRPLVEVAAGQTAGVHS